MSRLLRNLELSWAGTTSDMGTTNSKTNRRFRARSFGDGETGWGVFDVKRDRFLKDREVSRLTPDQIREPVEQIH